MPILNVNTNFAGQSGIRPTIIFIDTNDTYDEVKSFGYLNDLIKENLPISEGMLAAVTTKTTPNSRTTQSYIFGISKSDGNYSLVSSSGMIVGTTNIFAGGSASNVFTVPGLTSNSKGTAIIRTSTNTVSIARSLPGANTLTITFSGDPGANTTVDYNYSISGSP